MATFMPVGLDVFQGLRAPKIKRGNILAHMCFIAKGPACNFNQEHFNPRHQNFVMKCQTTKSKNSQAVGYNRMEATLMARNRPRTTPTNRHRKNSNKSRGKMVSYRSECILVNPRFG